MKKNIQGYTLIELMIAIALGLLVTAGILSLFVSSKRAYNENERAARLQENGRTALFMLATDLQHANFWGPLIDPSGIRTSLTAASGCASWVYAPTRDRFIGAGYSDSDPNALKNLITSMRLEDCISSEIKDDASIVGFKRVSSGSMNWPSLDPCDLFIRTDSSNGELRQKNGDCVGGTSSGPGSDSSQKDWEYQPKIYYIRTWSSVSPSAGQPCGDCIPTLCVAQGNPNLRTQCLVEGIEVMHIEYGIDNVNSDGVPDNYDLSPGIDTVTAEIYLLARDVEEDPLKIARSRTYQLGSREVAFFDKFNRAVFSTTVVAYNQRFLPVR